MALPALRLGIMVGNVAHPQTVIDGLWTQATGALGTPGPQLVAVAVYVDDGGPGVVLPRPGLSVVALDLKPAGRLAGGTVLLAARKGAIGVAGRLLRDNLQSRRVARALAAHAQARRALSDADVVVSSDPAADRAVWLLRKRSQAQLMHGPVAMMHALRQLQRA
ncbi:hypothetical protein B5P43_15460 [Bacillus sp. SRB_336]|nr:hypothetical protein B5P43_15460 [Bacillus sp. SRB_336]